MIKKVTDRNLSKVERVSKSYCVRCETRMDSGLVPRRSQSRQSRSSEIAELRALRCGTRYSCDSHRCLICRSDERYPAQGSGLYKRTPGTE